MGTGYRGTFVISWSQTELDGLAAAPLRLLTAGATWCWRGEAVRVDGPQALLRLDMAEGAEARRRRAARMVRRLVGAALSRQDTPDEAEPPDPLMEAGFVVTDGVRSHMVTLIETGGGADPLLMFHDDMPPRDRELWVVHAAAEGLRGAADGPDGGGVICFTPGTRIETPRGPCPVEDLSEGDLVSTRDNGAQEIRWIGSRRMTGARLFALPRLRPIRLRVGALGIDRPDRELLVSPEHRILVQGAVAQALFNTPEVLVMARDLVDGERIAVDLTVREVSYIHLLLPSHQVLWANGVETESFHPAGTDISSLREEDRARLIALDPALEHAPQAYGGFARRCLSAPEAAILMHEAA